MPIRRGRESRPIPSEGERAELARRRRTRALEEPLDVRPTPGSWASAFDVRNPRRATHYAIFLPEFPSRSGALCSCTDFGHRGLGTCKHIEAVVLWLEEHPTEGRPAPRPFEGAERWAEIDRAIGRFGTTPRFDPTSARGPGAVLLGGDGRPGRRRADGSMRPGTG